MFIAADSPSAETLSLARDASGNQPGSLVGAGTALTVMDAEWQKTKWMYQVRTEDGSIGWISGERLASRP